MGRRIFEAVLGVVLVIAAVILAYFFQQSYARGVELKSLPVPVAEIPPYTMLTETMFEWKDFPSALGDAYADRLVYLVGRISKSAIPAGLPVPLASVSSAGDFRLADPSLEILSIPITPASAVGGEVRIGELVNVYRLIPPAQKMDPSQAGSLGQASVTLVAEKVQVLSVLGSDGSQAGDTVSGRRVVPDILILAVNAEQRNGILRLIAETEQSAIMWITLAPVGQ